ncbi:bifunctional diguanylate cyclase/phosphodiesterase, partial [Hydrogenimonas sp.]
FESRSNLQLMHTYQQAANLSSIVSKTDTEGLITYVNDAFCTLSGYAPEELLGRTHAVVRHPDTPKKFYEKLWHTIREEKEVWRGIIRNRNKAGKSYYIDALIMPVLDLDGRILEYISLSHDITDIMHPAKQLQSALQHIQNPLLVYMKLADYEIVEEFYDAATFETIQKDVAAYLQRIFGTTFEFDRIYSLGGGEYAFILENPDSEEARQELLGLLRTYQVILREDAIDLGTFEYGVSVLMSVVGEKEKILESAKLGIKQMARDGGRFLVADGLADKVQRTAQENMRTLALVKEAIANGRIVSYFQPIVDNATGQVAKYESLVRLIDGDGNTLSPFFFLDIAKKSNLYRQITAIVLERSFDALLAQDREISINLSVKDIEHKRTRETIVKLLERHKEHAGRVVFELLEDENVESHATIRDFIATIKGYGVKIAIDDFGSGFSNYERLLEYQPDLLKIDGSLIKHILTSPYARSVVKSIVTFAREQGLQTVAEFVEDAEVFEAVRALGIDFSQGYYFGKPAALKT